MWASKRQKPEGTLLVLLPERKYTGAHPSTEPSREGRMANIKRNAEVERQWLRGRQVVVLLSHRAAGADHRLRVRPRGAEPADRILQVCFARRGHQYRPP